MCSKPAQNWTADIAFGLVTALQCALAVATVSASSGKLNFDGPAAVIFVLDSTLLKPARGGMLEHVAAVSAWFRIPEQGMRPRKPATG